MYEQYVCGYNGREAHLVKVCKNPIRLELVPEYPAPGSFLFESLMWIGKVAAEWTSVYRFVILPPEEDCGVVVVSQTKEYRIAVWHKEAAIVKYDSSGNVTYAAGRPYALAHLMVSDYLRDRKKGVHWKISPAEEKLPVYQY